MKRLLDLFSGAGGAGMGYHRAGFEVTGVDIKPQPRYPFTFVQADALEYLKEHGHEYDAIHASPPCQRFSRLPQTEHYLHESHADMVADTREELLRLGIPYVIENVVGSPLKNPTMLCGATFGLKTYRHRIFETSWLCMAPPHENHVVVCPKAGTRGIPEGGFISVCGDIGQVRYARRVMQIDWMTGKELAQAIPPAYTEFIGWQLMEHLRDAGCEKEGQV